MMRDLVTVKAAFRRKLESVIGPSIGRDLLWSEFVAALDVADHAGFCRALDEVRLGLRRHPSGSDDGDATPPDVAHHPV